MRSVDFFASSAGFKTQALATARGEPTERPMICIG